MIVLALAFFLRAKVTSTGVPGGVQLFWEAITIQMRDQIEGAIGMKIAPFVLPLAVTLFVFILVANWLSVLPVHVQRLRRRHATNCSSRRPPTSTSCWRWRCSCSSPTTRQASGAAASIGHPIELAKGHVAFLAPINLVEEIAKPISLSLRLFGNIFAGGIMVTLIALFPAVHHVGAQRDLESVRPFRRPHPGVHLRAADHPVLRTVDGTRPR